MKPTALRKLLFILSNIMITSIIFTIGFYRVHYIYEAYRGTDYNIYISIYSKNIYEWYASGSLFYYSPLFYLIFIPFRIIGMDLYFIFGYLFYFIGIAYCVSKMHPLLWLIVCLNLGFQFWVYFKRAAVYVNDMGIIW